MPEEASPAPAEAPPAEPADPAVPSPDAGLGAPALEPSAALAPAEPPRKSVTYQPEPLSWKPAAVTCLEKVSAWQAGQVVRTASESFCSTSFAWPQALQR